MLGATLAQAISPPPDLSVSQWADAKRVLSGKASAEPGPWRTERAEYTREIMDAFSDPQVSTVAFMAASQLGKTEILLNILGYLIDVDPCPVGVAVPNTNLVKDFSKARLTPMLDACPSLTEKVAPAKSRDSDNTLRQKGFKGGVLYLLSAESSADLSGRPVRIAIADEVDRMEDTKEGDPLALLAQRTSNFWYSKQAWFSSPRDKNTSRIEAKYLAGDQRKWWVPCPHCGAEQVMLFKHVTWDKLTDDNGDLVVDDRGKLIHLPETAAYHCPHCGAAWSEAERHAAVRAGRWIAGNPNAPAGWRSYWLNVLNSPWVNMPDLVRSWLEAKKLPGTLRTFTNTKLGETWEEQGITADADELAKRAEPYGLGSGPGGPGAEDSRIPAGVLLVAAAVDIQDNRFEVIHLGWGADYENWLLKHTVIPGDLTGTEVWEQLDQAIIGEYTTEDGRVLNIRAVGVDTGGSYPQQAYAFCKKRWGRRVWAFKGKSRGLGVPVWPLKMSKGGQVRVPLFVINVDESKKMVTDLLSVEEPGPGYCHFPPGLPDSFYRQFSAEKLITKYKHGFPVRVWDKKSGRPNEALDLYGYAYAVLCGLQETLSLDLAKLAKRAALARAKPQPPPGSKPVTAPAAPPRSGGASVSGYRPAPVLPADPYLL